MAIKNSTIMAKAWLQGSNDFQHRIPNPTQAGMKATIEALFDPMNKQYYNEFVDSLVNRIGKTIVKNKRWDNKLRAFKGDNLSYGSTVQEIANKWITAHTYDDADETLLKLNRPESAVWYHTVNRQDRYDISINEMELRRAFVDEYGLNEYVSSIMQIPYNSDAYDEYLAMKELIAFYENTWGFYKEKVSEITDDATGKKFLTLARAYSDKLQFPSTIYNAADIDVPVFADTDELVLITTPEVNASLDVNTLASVFNIDKADLKYSTVIIDEFPVPNAQALLTVKDWFVVHDLVYETTSFYNPKNLSTNYFLHHHEIISCSPFVPAILFTTDTGTTVPVINQTVNGITVSATPNHAKPGDVVQLVTNLTGALDPATAPVEVAPDAATFEVTAMDKAPSEDDSDPKPVAVPLNSRTYVDFNGKLHIQKSGLTTGNVLTVTATSSYINPSGDTTEYSANCAVTID